MDRPSIQELMEEKFDNLPSVVKEVINSEEIGQKISEISAKNNLKEEQEELLADEIVYVLFKITPISRFRQLIQDNIGLPPSRSLSVSTEVFGTVFSPIKKFLKEDDLDDASTSNVSFSTNNARQPINSGVNSPKVFTAPVDSFNNEAQNFRDLHTLNNPVLPENDIFSHHEVLSEIENPTPSIQTNIDSEINKSKIETFDENSISKSNNIPIKKEIYNDFDSSVNPITSIEVQNSEVNGVVKKYNSNQVFIPNSIHHDVGSNLSSFKPLDAIVETQTDTSRPASPAIDVINKLNTKLIDNVSHPKTESIVPLPKKTPTFDPYREPIE